MNSSNLNAAFCKCIVFACDNAIGLQCIFLLAKSPITLLRLLHRHVPRAMSFTINNALKKMKISVKGKETN